MDGTESDLRTRTLSALACINSDGYGIVRGIISSKEVRILRHAAELEARAAGLYDASGCAAKKHSGTGYGLGKNYSERGFFKVADSPVSHIAGLIPNLLYVMSILYNTPVTSIRASYYGFKFYVPVSERTFDTSTLVSMGSVGQQRKDASSDGIPFLPTHAASLPPLPTLTPHSSLPKDIPSPHCELLPLCVGRLAHMQKVVGDGIRAAAKHFQSNLANIRLALVACVNRCALENLPITCFPPTSRSWLCTRVPPAALSSACAYHAAGEQDAKTYLIFSALKALCRGRTTKSVDQTEVVRSVLRCLHRGSYEAYLFLESVVMNASLSCETEQTEPPQATKKCPVVCIPAGCVVLYASAKTTTDFWGSLVESLKFSRPAAILEVLTPHVFSVPCLPYFFHLPPVPFFQYAADSARRFPA